MNHSAGSEGQSNVKFQKAMCRCKAILSVLGPEFPNVLIPVSAVVQSSCDVYGVNSNYGPRLSIIC